MKVTPEEKIMLIVTFLVVSVALIFMASSPSCEEMGGKLKSQGTTMVYNAATKTMVPVTNYACVMPGEE